MSPLPADPFLLDCRGRRLDARPGRAHVMGILNVTPDSFSDGGQFFGHGLDVALRRAETMLGEGAVLIDVGGESTRPRGTVYGEGAAPVGEDEEKRRVLPVIEAVAARFPEALISVDTYKPGVAAAALEAGAHLVNDVTGLRGGDGTARAAARFGAPLVVMHALGEPGAMPHAHAYGDVVEEVKASLAASVRAAEAAGVHDVIVDPGFGFGKSAEENLRLVGRADAFLALGRPVLVGISRKSTIGAVLGQPGTPVPVEDRLFGTLGATAVAVLRGASIVRTHDVRATAEMLRVLMATVTAAADTPATESAAFAEDGR
ncbi:MAG: dihydropteroate synthase [Rhodothermales bacterium]